MTTSRNGLSGSVTQACRMCVVIGSRTPAIREISELQPAVQLSTTFVRTCRGWCPRLDVAVRALDPGDLRVGMDLDPAAVGAARQPQTTASWRIIPPGGW